MSRQIRWQWVPFEGLSSVDLYALLSLRQAVLVVEQSCPYLDMDGRDFGAWHLLGWRGHELVAYLRARPAGPLVEGHATIERIVTAETVRGTGLGRPLVREGLTRIQRTFGQTPVYVAAQSHLRVFYESLDFSSCGEAFEADGIRHLPMHWSA